MAAVTSALTVALAVGAPLIAAWYGMTDIVA